MPTLLTNRRMHPALKARIERSLHGDRHSSVWKRRMLVGLRFAVPAACVIFVFWLGAQLNQDRAAFAERKARLESDVQEELLPVGDPGLARLSKVQRWLGQEAGPYDGDVTRAELKDPRQLSDTLRRGAYYLRVDLSSAGSGAAAKDLAETSSRDAFLLCFLSPPKDRTLRSLLGRVRTAYAGDERLGWDTRFAASLNTVYTGLPYVQEAWLERVQRTDEIKVLETLEREYARAPVPAAKQALKSQLLLAVFDEAGGPASGKGSGSVVELDGERPHPVRVSLIDLEGDRVLLRRRADVNPDWIPEATRVRYARGLDACALAYDIRQSLSTPVASQ